VLNDTLYPDIVRHGGLAAALTEAARAASVDLGALTTPGEAHGEATVVIDSDRGWISVIPGAARRVFIIDIANAVHNWAAGATEELAEVVAVASSWRGGATLRQLHDRFPFMTYTRLAQGYEDGNPVEVQWAELLEDPHLTRIRPLLRAARADERLGRLFPMVSHHTHAIFDLDHPKRWPIRSLSINMTIDGAYEVGGTWTDDEPRRFATLADAVDEGSRLVAEAPPTPG
jgi:hypothetical protein